VQQHRDLVPTLSAVENIFWATRSARKAGASSWISGHAGSGPEAGRRFEVDLDLDCPVSQLRVSEQGIVAICKALAAQSKVLLIDEASAPLDNTERQTLYRILQQLRDDGKAILYISHHLDEVFHIGQRVTVLRNGRVVCTVAVKDIDYDGLIGAMTGSKRLYQRAAKAVGFDAGQRPLLEFRGVGSPHLHGVSFSLNRGEILGFAGLEGSHKDEIARVIYGLSDYTQGQVLFDGQPFRPADPLRAIRGGVGLVPTDRKNAGLVTCRSVAENVILAAINKAGRARWPFLIRRVAQANAAAGDQDLRRKAAGRIPERRQPAEGAPVQVAGGRRRPAPAAGTHGGDRRWHPGELYEIFRGLAGQWQVPAAVHQRHRRAAGALRPHPHLVRKAESCASTAPRPPARTRS
jgi:ribose transport system ATP-binding protein